MQVAQPIVVLSAPVVAVTVKEKQNILKINFSIMYCTICIPIEDETFLTELFIGRDHIVHD